MGVVSSLRASRAALGLMRRRLFLRAPKKDDSGFTLRQFS
jgi:hypothetical protein